MTLKWYDPQNNRLIYTKERADTGYWDRRWAKRIKKRIRGSARISWATKINRCFLNFHVRLTKKFIHPEHGPVLEGGCGLGKKVELLQFCGFQCIGVDYAKETVKAINENIPELDIRYGDIRKLDFPDDMFAGYWSLGVIEHFWGGYKAIADEMRRVIRPGGYLFVSFPYMSLFRKLRARSGFYKVFKGQDKKRFRQFALDHKDVIKDFENKDFDLIMRKPKGVLFGLKDEDTFLAPVVDFIFKHKDRNLLTKTVYWMVDSLSSFLLGRVFGHTILLVLRKK